MSVGSAITAFGEQSSDSMLMLLSGGSAQPGSLRRSRCRHTPVIDLGRGQFVERLLPRLAGRDADTLPEPFLWPECELTHKVFQNKLACRSEIRSVSSRKQNPRADGTPVKACDSRRADLALVALSYGRVRTEPGGRSNPAPTTYPSQAVLTRLLQVPAFIRDPSLPRAVLWIQLTGHLASRHLQPSAERAVAVSPDFSISIRSLPNHHIVALHGELDMESARGVADAIAEVAGSTVIVDLSDLTFMDSTGISALVVARNRILTVGQGQLVVTGPTRIVRRAMDIVGLSDWIVEWSPDWDE